MDEGVIELKVLRNLRGIDCAYGFELHYIEKWLIQKQHRNYFKHLNQFNIVKCEDVYHV